MGEFTNKYLKIKGHMMIYEELRLLQKKYDKSFSDYDELTNVTYEEITKMLNVLCENCLDMIKAHTEQ